MSVLGPSDEVKRRNGGTDKRTLRYAWRKSPPLVRTLAGWYHLQRAKKGFTGSRSVRRLPDRPPTYPAFTSWLAGHVLNKMFKSFVNSLFLVDLLSLAYLHTAPGKTSGAKRRDTNPVNIPSNEIPRRQKPVFLNEIHLS